MAGLVLFGWLLDIALLKHVVPGLVAMNPLTAVLFLLSALSLWLLRDPDGDRLSHRRGRALALVVVAFAILKLLDLFAGTQFELDRLLFRDQLDGAANAIPNRMAPNTANGFLMFGTALWSLDYARLRWPSLVVTLAGGFLSLLAVVGYVYGLTSFYGINNFIPMALHTAICFLLLAVGILASRPHSPVMTVITNDTIAGLTARRLLPVVVVIPVVLGLLLLTGIRLNVFPVEYGASLFAVCIVLIFLVLIWRAARTLWHLEAARSAAEARIQNLNEDLMLANKELESFSYSVSHDLRAPLRAINGFSRILMSDYADDLPDDARRYLGLVSANATQMGRLIDDLLAFSRLNRQAVSLQAVDPAQLARDALAELHDPDEAREIEVIIHPMPPVQADPALLRQVYSNLLGNALKYTGTRSRACIEVGAQEQDGATVYYVLDNGVGFDMKYADKLFAVFQRLHRSEEFEGTGVGLATAQRIIHRHGGRIWAEAEVDKGARFYFTIGETP